MSLLTRVGFALVVCGGMFALPDVAAADPAAAPPAAETGGAKTDVTKTPTKAELGAMLKKCSDEADAKGLTVQMGKGAQRKAYRRACMAKNGVMPRGKT